MKLVRQFATTRAATWLWSAPPLNSARAKPHTKKTPNQLQLACRRSGCCAARKPLGFHTPAEPATFDPTPIKDRGTLVLRNSFGTARASTWLWWWSALPQRARSHQNKTHIWFMKLSVTMVMVHHGSLKSPVDPPMVHHGSPKSQISGFMDQTGS